MQYSLNFFSIILFLSAAISGVVAVVAYRRRAVNGATTILAIMLALTLWSSVYAIENLAPTLGWHKFWSQTQYISIASIPVLWLIFALQYSQQEKAPPASRLIWLWVIPVLTNLMVWTNDLHGLIWPHMSLIQLGGVTLLNVDHGIYFWIQAIYDYLAILLGTLLFIRQALRADDAYRSQAATMLLAAIVLLVGNGLYIFNLLPFHGLDITPFSFTIASLLLAWGLFRHRLLDLMPVASEAILRNMSTGIVVTDSSTRIVFVNPALESLAHLAPGTSIGSKISEVLYNWPNVTGDPTNKSRTTLEATITNRQYFFEIQTSPLYEKKIFIGCIYDIRNITEQVKFEDRQRLLRQGIHKEETSADFAPILMVVRIPDGKIVDVNTEFQLHTGYTREEALEHTAFQLGLVTMENRTVFTRLSKSSEDAVNEKLTITTKSGHTQIWKISLIKTSLDGVDLQLLAARLSE